MKKIINVDSNGKLIYNGALSSKEIEQADEFLNILRKEIPEIEQNLEDQYGKTTIEYKYYLGLFLESMLEKYNISTDYRRKFWDEIKTLVSNEKRKRKDGIKSKTRSFYEQCFVLSKQELQTVKKLSWRQWQDLLDRTNNRVDERIFDWIKQVKYKIREDDWREFEKALHLYLSKKDTSVFDDTELFLIYDSIILMCQIWRKYIKDYAIKYPRSLKLKKIGSWAKKYYSKCFLIQRQKNSLSISEEICRIAFAEIMNLK